MSGFHGQTPGEMWFCSAFEQRFQQSGVEQHVQRPAVECRPKVPKRERFCVAIAIERMQLQLCLRGLSLITVENLDPS